MKFVRHAVEDTERYDRKTDGQSPAPPRCRRKNKNCGSGKDSVGKRMNKLVNPGNPGKPYIISLLVGQEKNYPHDKDHGDKTGKMTPDFDYHNNQPVAELCGGVSTWTRLSCSAEYFFLILLMAA